ncbi:Hypothetical protein POVR2_LOCUS350 [uncultured virus]|nr:Hypothetical protein POVR2_LOCUS350 [uncultured virus]
MQVLLLLLASALLVSSTWHPIPRQVLVTKFIPDVGPTDPTAFTDPGRLRLKSWNILTASQLTALDTTDRLFFYNKTGINVSLGLETPPGSGIIYGSTWAYFPFELESTERLDWVVSDTAHPLRTSPLRRHNWILADGGNTLAFLVDGTFPGGEWQGLRYYAGGIMANEYVIMVPNVTKSQWKNNYELHKCRTELEPGVGMLNVYGQTDSIVTKSCIGVRDGKRSTTLVTNVYTNTSATTRSERKTHAWTWSW